MNNSNEFTESILTHDSHFTFKPTYRLSRFSRFWTLMMLLTTDSISLIASLVFALKLFEWLDGGKIGFNTSNLGLILPAFGGIFALLGLYRLRGIDQVEELRLLTCTITMIFALLAAFYLLIDELNHIIAFFGLGWLVAIVLFPLSRWTVRGFCTAIGFWGEPVVIIGNGSLSHSLIHFLLKNLYCGMRPVLVVDGSERESGETAAKDFTIPVVSLDKWPSISDLGCQVGVSTAIIVAPDLPTSLNASFARGEHLGFSKIITITQQINTRNFGLLPLDLGGILGLEERHYELNVLEDLQVRIFDLILVMLSLPILAPLFLCISAAIRLDSEGSVVYRQTRIGKGAKKFKVLKFRTMLKDADAVLDKYLEENPKLHAEWKENHKLKDDPRITRVGKFLRKTSLDELPQLWNVFKGEMSLVGPRPIVDDEIERYADKFKYYSQVPPGITGLWQVSGRSDVDYEQRVRLDEYYVRNRSIWLDLHIIIRTFLTVIRRHGAY